MFVIVLYSKWQGRGGTPVYLGSQFNTHEEAKNYIENQVCARCNYADIKKVPDDYVWVNKLFGFQKVGFKQSLRTNKE